MYVDLHSHTTVSDGVLSPEELVRLAVERGLKYLAITDHDATEAIEPALEAAKSYPSFTIIPGVEMSTDVTKGEVHLLGYFIDYRDSDFQRTLAHFRDSRRERARKMVQKLEAMGVHIQWERVLEVAGDGSIGRPHIAQVMLEAGYISSIKEAFVKYLARDGPAYVARERLSPVEAVGMVTKVGGLPVLAHPGDIQGLDSLIVETKSAGLVGMEVHYDGYSKAEVERLAKVAKKHDLVACGGSDYHGEGIGAQTDLGDVDVPMESVERLFAIARQRPNRMVPK